jgi:hypothetical protein
MANRVRRQDFDCLGGIAVGDFVFKDGYWRKLESVWDEACSTWARREGNHHKDYVFYQDIRLLHRASDPWDYHEVKHIADENGYYGLSNGPAVPRQYLYAGPLRLSAWAYKFRKYAYDPKYPPFRNPLEDFKLEDVTGILEKLQNVRDANGWCICPTFVAMEQYNRTINVRKQLMDTGLSVSSLT